MHAHTHTHTCDPTLSYQHFRTAEESSLLAGLLTWLMPKCEVISLFRNKKQAGGVLSLPGVGAQVAGDLVVPHDDDPQEAPENRHVFLLLLSFTFLITHRGRGHLRGEEPHTLANSSHPCSSELCFSFSSSHFFLPSNPLGP